MQSDQARYLAPSGRFFLMMLGLGALVGGALLLADAPFWGFFLAPLAIAPLLVHELRGLGGGGEVDGLENLARRRSIALYDWARYPSHWRQSVLLGCAVVLSVTIAVLDIYLIDDGAWLLVVPLSFLLWIALGLRRQQHEDWVERRYHDLLRAETELLRAEARAQEAESMAMVARRSAQWVLLAIESSADLERAVDRFDTEQDALEAGRRYVRRHGGGEVIAKDEWGGRIVTRYDVFADREDEPAESDLETS
jgi:hypothetical protein